jgi:hypothetical protein
VRSYARRRDHPSGKDDVPDDGIMKGELAAYYEASNVMNAAWVDVTL